MVEKVPNVKHLAPVIIGGMEGSGTRVISWLVEDLGVDMQPALFEMSFKPFDDFCKHRHIKFLKGVWPDEKREPSFALLRDAVLAHPRAKENPPHRWGMKSPRSLSLFPWLQVALPSAKFIHIMRFPGDVNFGRKKNYVGWFQGMIPDVYTDFEEKYFWVWKSLNGRVYDHCKRRIPERYMVIHEEDLFFHQPQVIQRLTDFLETEKAFKWNDIRHPKPRKTIGRFERDGGTIPNFARRELEAFGYKEGVEENKKRRPWSDNEPGECRTVGGG